MDARDGRDVGRGREVIQDGIQETLNAFVFESRTAENRRDVQAQRRFANNIFHFLFGDYFTLEVFHEELVIVLSNCLKEVDAPMAGCVFQVMRDIDLVPRHALRLIVPDDGLVRDQVH
ncbi:MAG: hypothetical protein ACO23O_10620, partial [Ilumatobacteraceae bacterium]